MVKTNEIKGYITAITEAQSLFIVSFQAKNDRSTLALTLSRQHYYDLFPAGTPEIGVEVIAVIEETSEKITLKAIYDPTADFLAEDEIPEIVALDAASSPKPLQSVAQRQQLLADLPYGDEDVSELAKLHDDEMNQPPERVNYGNPVTGEGGQDD